MNIQKLNTVEFVPVANADKLVVVPRERRDNQHEERKVRGKMTREQILQFHEDQLKLMAAIQKKKETKKLLASVESSKNQDDLENQMVIGNDT